MKNIYEIGFLINPDFSQQEAEEKLSNMVTILEKKGASVLSEGEVVDIELAYEIKTKIGSSNVSFNEAYFTWVKFESDTSLIEKIKKEVDLLKNDYFRYLITKTIADDELTDLYKKNIKDENEEDDEDEFIEEKVDEKENIDADNIDTEEENQENSDIDDLTKIEGIGPKIAEVLAQSEIKTFKDLAESDVERIKEILSENSLSMHNPETWPKQSQLAVDGKWDELDELQEELNGGV